MDMDLKICRLCCESDDVTISIFKSSYDGVELGTCIMHCFKNVHLQKNDGLPALICVDCEQQVLGYYQFVLRCEASDKKLRSLVPRCADNSVPDVKDENEDLKDELPFEEQLDEEQLDGEQLDGEQLVQDNSLEIKDELSDGNVSVENEQEPILEPQEDKSENAILKDKCKVRNNHETDSDIKQEPEDKTEKALNNKCQAENKKNKKFKRIKSICSVCGRHCANPSTLAVHMRAHSNERPYPCTYCAKSFKDNSTLKRHMSRTHLKVKRQKDFTCESCGKSFYSKNDLITHIRTHTGETPYACPLCPGKFKQISAMLRHKRRHTGEKLHSCQECSKSFCTKEELKNHLHVHSNIKKFSCTICNILFKYKNNLKKHIKTHTNDNKTFICNFCGRICTTKGNLRIHICRQHSEKSGYCNICTKLVANIEVHMWKHTGERPLKCELCTSSFFELKALGRHINFKHKKTDKHKCETEGCLKSFPIRSMLDFHTAKFHSTQVPFPCDRCSRGFYRKNDLARHKIGTHKEKLK